MSLVRPSLSILAAMFAVLAFCGPLPAASIQGYVYNPYGDILGEAFVVTNQSGNLGSYAQYGSDPSTGFYILDSLASGTYCVGINEKNDFPRVIKPGISVGSGATALNYQYDCANFVGAYEYSGWPRSEWDQSFVATGNSITSVSIKTGASTNVRVTIHDTDPYGAQIGPARYVGAGYGAGSQACWSAGEVPTIPGHIYCAKFENAAGGGIQPEFGSVKEFNGNFYPEGKTWYEGIQVDTPLSTVIGQDDDGILTTVNTAKAGASVVDHWISSLAGQTFTANGSSLLSFSVLLGTGGNYIVSVHDGVGSGGAGGTQIGPAKVMIGIAWNARSMVVWSPGEVPTTVGHTYYIKLRRSDGSGFTLYAGTNEYAGGTCYIAGVDQGYDMSTTIASEAYSGSTALPTKVSISNVAVSSRSYNSATITWQSFPATSTNYVQYGSNTPYTNSASDTANSMSHSVTITGLQPNTLYHYRVVSKAAGFRDGINRDLAFVTDPIMPNLLSNPGFESGATSPWTLVGTGAGMQYYPAGGSSAWFGGVKAHSGNYFLGGATNGGQLKGGACQRVAVAAGRPLTLRAWLWTHQVDNYGKGKDVIVCGRVGIDPTGGTDVNSTNIVWSTLATAQDWWGSHTKWWIDMAVSATPAGSYATAFLQAGTDTGIAWTVYCWDDAMLTQEPATVSTTPAGLSGVSDGSKVSLPNLIVTSLASQAGATYIEQSNRVAGVRVEMLDAPAVGDSVSVSGYVGTKPSGERYIYGGKLASDTPSTQVASMAVVAKSIGKVGPGNVGLLMRVCGKVAAGGTGYVYLNDGSLSGSGLKVYTTSLATPPAAGSTAAFTGVVQLEGANPSAAIPVLYPRSQADCQTVSGG